MYNTKYLLTHVSYIYHTWVEGGFTTLMLQVGFHKLFTEHIFATLVLKSEENQTITTKPAEKCYFEKNRMLRYNIIGFHCLVTAMAGKCNCYIILAQCHLGF